MICNDSENSATASDSGSNVSLEPDTIWMLSLALIFFFLWPFMVLQLKFPLQPKKYFPPWATVIKNTVDRTAGAADKVTCDYYEFLISGSDYISQIVSLDCDKSLPYWKNMLPVFDLCTFRTLLPSVVFISFSSHPYVLYASSVLNLFFGLCFGFLYIAQTPPMCLSDFSQAAVTVPLPAPAQMSQKVESFNFKTKKKVIL